MVARNPFVGVLAVALVLVFVTACSRDHDDTVGGAPDFDESAWRADVETWRQGRLDRLTAEDGWLSLMALAFPGEGEWSVGRSPDADLIMVSGPERWGQLTIGQYQAWFEAADDAVLVDGSAPSGRVGILDEEASDSMSVAAGTGAFRVQRRPSGLAFRARDSQAATRLNFAGVQHFPVSLDWRIEAEWQPHDPPRDIEVANVLGELIMTGNPGRAIFEIDDQTFILEALEADDALFFIFADRTSGRETFGLGRFLYSDLPVNARVVLDFNRAYNPPCAFTEFTSCPLPPQSNRLDLRVEAGELRPADAY